MPETPPDVVTARQWLAARVALLDQEKELTRAQDRLNAARRRLPMTRVDKDYRFTGPGGDTDLLAMFEGREQLVVHHFMWDFGLDADGVEHPRETGCSSCSSAADDISGLRGLHARNTTLAAVTRPPHPTLAAFSDRMGWTFPWYPSVGSEFNYDFHATIDERVAPVQIHNRSEAEMAAAGAPYNPALRGDWPGLSTFLRIGDDVFHTYSTYGRGIEQFHNGNRYLDLTPLGRQEDWEEPANRATPLGKQVGGPGQRFPDEHEIPGSTCACTATS